VLHCVYDSCAQLYATQIWAVLKFAYSLGLDLIFTSAEEGGYVFSSVCLSICLFVCLSVRLLANLWTDFDEIFWRGRAWLKDQVIQFWWRSGSRFGSGSPKSEIRILRSVEVCGLWAYLVCIFVALFRFNIYVFSPLARKSLHCCIAWFCLVFSTKPTMVRKNVSKMTNLCRIGCKTLTWSMCMCTALYIFFCALICCASAIACYQL